VRFHALRLKAQYWKIWRDTMPRALQAKEAREMHRKAFLGIIIQSTTTPLADYSTAKAFEKWTQAYKTKLELKAVAYVILHFIGYRTSY
jgi:protein SFI1